MLAFFDGGSFRLPRMRGLKSPDELLSPFDSVESSISGLMRPHPMPAWNDNRCTLAVMADRKPPR